MAERDLLKDGAEYFYAGCDSYTLPRALSNNEFIASMNTVCRGGIIQTRPGTDSLYSIPGVNLQGFKLFTPSFGAAHHVIAVDGYIYASAAPFRTYRLLPNLRFNPTSKYVVFEECLQSTDYTVSGELIPLDRARKILIIQDGLTRAGYWDGGNSRHLNPTPSSGDNPVEGLDETVIGLWMKWSGNRLWVEHNGKLMASDLGNPLRFKDAQIINEGRAFYLPGECTGMINTPDQKGLIVFTRNTGSLFQTHVSDRTIWFDMQDFQSIIFPKTGCASPRSIVLQYGLIWWFSPHGLINSDQALSSNRTSRIDYQDNEMICSKGNMGPDLSMICSSSFENYLLVSVPSGDVVNRHTWCLDQAVFEGPLNAWNSYWTGWNPVEWSAGEVDGEERIFFASRDNGGCLRIWEAMKPHRTDNGQPITCFAQMREHNFGDSKSLKKFHNAEFYCHEILGDVSWMACAASTKGSFYRIGGSELVATPGGVYFDELYDRNKCLYGHRPQVRNLRTTSDNKLNDCNEGGIESDFPNDLDRAFSLLLVWSGRLGVSGYSIYAQVDEDSTDGDCVPDEVGPLSLSEQGCSAKDKFVNTCTFPKFDSSQTSSVPCDRAGRSIQAMADAESIISQADADRKARGAATLRALSLCECSPEVFWNTEQSFTAFCPDGYDGDSVTKRIRARQLFSYRSQAAADASAIAAAKEQAESMLMCSQAGNFRVFPGSESNSFSGDDDSTSIQLGFLACFSGTMFSEIWVCTNGVLTFTGPFGSASTEPLATTTINILAGLWEDWLVLPESPILYGTGTLGGHLAMAATWRNVMQFSGDESITNSIQIVVIDRSDLGSGFFDVEMNYEKVQWPSIGGRIGYRGFELPGVDIEEYYLDTNLSTGMIHNSSGVPFDGDVRPGRYTYQFRGICADD